VYFVPSDFLAKGRLATHSQGTRSEVKRVFQSMIRGQVSFFFGLECSEGLSGNVSVAGKKAQPKHRREVTLTQKKRHFEARTG